MDTPKSLLSSMIAHQAFLYSNLTRPLDLSKSSQPPLHGSSPYHVHPESTILLGTSWCFQGNILSRGLGLAIFFFFSNFILFLNVASEDERSCTESRKPLQCHEHEIWVSLSKNSSVGLLLLMNHQSLLNVIVF